VRAAGEERLMGAPQHSPEVRARAIGALYASADEVEGELLPNFSAVSRRVGLTPGVLHRWWGERDKRDDEKAREEAVRARDEARQAGGKDWLDATLADLKARVGAIAKDKAKWESAPVADAARGAKDLATAVKTVSETMGAKDVDGSGAGDGGGGAGAIDGAVRRAMDRARGVGTSGEGG
jgi:hypothetical protein